jgi:hypothetical protein
MYDMISHACLVFNKIYEIYRIEMVFLRTQGIYMRNDCMKNHFNFL